MSPIHELSYNIGKKVAWATMLRQCIKELGVENPDAGEAKWILEREAAISTLRQVCDDFGDNDWKDDLHLSDIIEKHLARHLHNR